jgi:hypothetical protein
MVRLTTWADSLVDPVARRTGIPREHLAVTVGGEIEATVLELVSELFTRGIGKVLVDVAAGAIATGYAVYGKGVPERLRRELLQVGTHLLARALEAVKYAEFKTALDSFVNALRTRGLAYALSTIVATPGEAMARMGLAAAPAPAPAPAAGARAVAVTVVPPAPAPAPAPGVKVY